jgi:phage gpG-like protein
MTVALSITGGHAIGRIERRLRKIADTRLDDVLDELGTLITDQTQVRIADEKKSPRNQPWPPWSSRYAKTRHSGHSLLRSEGHLLESIQHLVSFAGGVGELQVGTNVRYASAHHFGIGVPMRRFLGISGPIRREIEEELRDWMKKLIR